MKNILNTKKASMDFKHKIRFYNYLDDLMLINAPGHLVMMKSFRSTITKLNIWITYL